MLKKLYAILLIILLASLAGFSQETESAAISAIPNVKLPNNAERILPNSVPAEINAGLKQIVDAGDGKLVEGEREVLAWSGGNYKMADAENLISQFRSNLQKQGWEYELGGTDGGITVFSVSGTNPARRVVLGFYIPTDEALVLAWTEVFSSDSNSRVSNNTVQPSASNSRSSSGGIVGTWTNGTVSSISEKNLSTGMISSRGGSTFKYVFNSNGTFEFIGLMNSTMYGCTTSLFNDKRGRYEINGSGVTLIPNKNFWRKQNSCAPNSNSEQNYKLDRETFELSTKTDEYGKFLICLADAKGETCYRRED
jgi:hypothetical protein